MSFYHMGIVIAKTPQYFYVLPITSYDVNNSSFSGVVDYTKFSVYPKKPFYLMKKSDFSFLEHDSVLKTSDIRTVSHTRMRFRKGHIDPNCEFFKVISSIAFQYVFPYHFSELDKKEKNLSKIKMELFMREVSNVTYEVTDISELKSLLHIPIEYKVKFHMLEDCVSSEDVNGCILEVSDKYGQMESRKISYIIKQKDEI